jgi:hypothetical protein
MVGKYSPVSIKQLKYKALLADGASVEHQPLLRVSDEGGALSPNVSPKAVRLPPPRSIPRRSG